MLLWNVVECCRHDPITTLEYHHLQLMHIPFDAQRYAFSWLALAIHQTSVAVTVKYEGLKFNCDLHLMRHNSPRYTNSPVWLCAMTWHWEFHPVPHAVCTFRCNFIWWMQTEIHFEMPVNSLIFHIHQISFLICVLVPFCAWWYNTNQCPPNSLCVTKK